MNVPEPHHQFAASAPLPGERMSRGEFIAVTAAMMALTAPSVGITVATWPEREVPANSLSA
jgi:hypothetical protein